MTEQSILDLEPSVGDGASIDQHLEPGAPHEPALDRRDTLWRHAAFLNLWAAETISQFGTQITMIALPLIAALTLGASPLQMGVLAAAMTAPSLLIALFVGVWVDRLRRRPLLIAADLSRAVVLLGIPIAWWLDVLSIGVLYAVAIVVGSFTVLFDVAYASFLPSIVRRDQLVDGNSKLEMSASTAQVGGPALGGMLVSVMVAPLVLLLDAFSYLVSGFFIWRIKDTERVARSQPLRGSIRRDVIEGLRTLLSDPVLRALAASSATVTLFGYAFLSVYVLYMTDDLGIGPGAIGLVFGAGGVGALIGAVLAAPISRRAGTGPTIVVARLAFGLGGLLVPLAFSFKSIALPLVVAAEFLQWLALVMGEVNARSLRQALTPDRILGRVNASFRFLVAGSIPIGGLVGGVLGEYVGIRETLLIGVAGMLLAFVWLLFAPVWRIKVPPSDLETAPRTTLDTPS